MRYLFFISVLLYFNLNYGYERSDAFIVTAYSNKLAIVAPQRFDPRVNVIVENKTLISLLGKIESGQGNVLSYISVPSGKTRSVEVGRKLKEKLYFIPLAPAFQKVELKVGSKPYEIPPKE